MLVCDFLHFRLAFRALLVPPNIIYIIKENKHLKDMLQSSTLKKKKSIRLVVDLMHSLDIVSFKEYHIFYDCVLTFIL